jgi:hypothetical protein
MEESRAQCGFCLSEEIITDYDVGYDIWEGGEEKQHVDTCIACYAWRFHCNVLTWATGEEFITLGDWHPKEDLSPLYC